MTSSFLCPTRSGRTVAASIEGNVQDTIQLKEITINAGSTVEGLIFLFRWEISVLEAFEVWFPKIVRETRNINNRGASCCCVFGESSVLLYLTQ